VLRPAEGKSNAIIIDHGGSWRELPLPDESIEWSLHEKAKRARNAKLEKTERNPETMKVERKLIVEENKGAMYLVNGKQQDLGDVARKRLQKMVRLYRQGIVPVEAVRSQMRNAPLLDDNSLDLISQVTGVGPNWAEQHKWLNKLKAGNV